jgi:hypothetical protein
VAATADPYGLYSSNTEAFAGALTNIGITQSYTKKSGYTYSFSDSADAQAGNCPMFDVTWGDAARFCNWLANGQPTGAEGPGTTETGSYTLGGATSSAALLAVTRNPGATYFIPSENEWYKAAYYNPTKGTYWAYPTQSNAAPSNVLSATGTNNANYFNGGDTDPTNLLTPVGAFAASPGPYGTYDMGGDVFEWNEAVIGGSSRGLRGGEWFEGASLLASSQRVSGYFPDDDSDYFGFRVAAADPGDANGDGQVDVNDLTIVLSHFNQTGCTWSQGCMDGDPTGRVDVNDLTIVLSNFGQGIAAGAGNLSAVPEPGALALATAAFAALLGSLARRKRKY